MKMSYKKLWKILIDEEMSKKNLADSADLSQHTINKLNHGETVTTDTLAKICSALSCNIGDICEVVFEECDSKEQNRVNHNAN